MRKLALFTLGFTLAAALLVYCFGGVGWAAAAIAGVLCTFCFLLRGNNVRRIAVVLLGACVGSLWCSAYTVLQPSAQDYCTGEAVSFTAVAESTAMPTSYGFSVEAVVNRQFSAVLYFEEEHEVILPGDLLSGSAVFREVSFTMQGNDDLYRAAHGIRMTGSIRDTLSVERQRTVGLSHTLARFALSMKENLHTAFSSPAAGYFTALAVGDCSGLPYEFENRLSLCGLSHAVSLSGMHVSILMSAVLLLCLRKKELAAWLGVPVLVLFAMLSGANPATVRAVIMQTVLFAGLFVKREYDPITALSAALFFLLCHNPWCIAQWGLQLSFLSTLGIVVLCPKLLVWLQNVCSAFWRGVLYVVFTPIAVTLSATVFTLPLTAAYFGVISLAAPVCNLLCLWSVTVSFIGGLLTALAGFFSPALAQGMAAVLTPFYDYLDIVLRIFAAIPQTAVFSQAPLLFAWAAFAYLLLVGGILLRCRWHLVPLCLAASFLLCFCLHTRSVPEHEFTMLDVGQGQCLVCIRGDDTWLIDCGGEGEEAGEVAARYLLSRGITSVDGVILTHFDADHTGGLPHLQRRLKVKSVHTPQTVTEVTEFPLEGGMLTVYPAFFGENDNDTGLCILASAGDYDILITGDLPQDAEAEFLSVYPISRGDVLVAGHHGAATSTSMALLDVFRPKTVLISAGDRYGHPAESTLSRIAQSGASAYATKTEGNLTVRW